MSITVSVYSLLMMVTISSKAPAGHIKQAQGPSKKVKLARLLLDCPSVEHFRSGLPGAAMAWRAAAALPRRVLGDGPYPPPMQDAMRHRSRRVDRRAEELAPVNACWTLVEMAVTVWRRATVTASAGVTAEAGCMAALCARMHGGDCWQAWRRLLAGMEEISGGHGGEDRRLMRYG
jgi:hypothetical protein